MYQNTTPIKSLAYRRLLIANDVHASDAVAMGKIQSHHGDDQSMSDQKV